MNDNRMNGRNTPANNSGELSAVERVRESVSALFDGEAGELEIRRLLSSAEPQWVNGAWRDYQLQRDALQGLDVRFSQFDISARVQAAIADDAVPLRAAGGSAWWRPFASIAVAASVATVVVIGARGFNPAGGFNPVDGSRGTLAQSQLPTSSNVGRAHSAPIQPAGGGAMASEQMLIASNAASNGLPNSTFSRNEVVFKGLPAAQTVGFEVDRQAQLRLQQFLLQHAERAALNNNQGEINFAKPAPFIIQ